MTSARATPRRGLAPAEGRRPYCADAAWTARLKLAAATARWHGSHSCAGAERFPMHTGPGAPRREVPRVVGGRRRGWAEWLGLALALCGLTLVAAHGALSSAAAPSAGPETQADGIWRPAL